MIHEFLALTAVALVLALGSGCFQPTYTEGIGCSPEDTCPGDLVCDTRDRRCRFEPLPACVRDEDCPRGTCDLEQNTCNPATCGDGVIDTAAGETCEPDTDPCCNATCDGPVAAGTVCRAASGACDVAETCDGATAACPADELAPDGSACDDCPDGSGLCDQCTAGVCTNECGNGSVDGTVGEQCDGADDGGCPGFCQSDCSCAYPASCQEYLMTVPSLPDGVYTIDPDGPGGEPPFMVSCDMTTDGGGFTRLFYWDRETDPTTHTAASLAGLMIDEVAEAADPDVSPMSSIIDQPDRIRWSDVDFTYDALSYRRDVPFDNIGDIRVDVHYEGWSMELSAIWLYADAGGAPQDVLCWSDAEAEPNYTSAEHALIPYACAQGVPDGTTFTWNRVEERGLNGTITAFHLRSLHSDVNGDFSYLYRLAVWVR